MWRISMSGPSRTNWLRLIKPLLQEKYPQTLGKINQLIEKFETMWYGPLAYCCNAAVSRPNLGCLVDQPLLDIPCDCHDHVWQLNLVFVSFAVWLPYCNVLDILLSLSHNLWFFTVAGLQCYCSTVPMTSMGTTPTSVSELIIDKMKLIIQKVPSNLTMKQEEC